MGKNLLRKNWSIMVLAVVLLATSMAGSADALNVFLKAEKTCLTLPEATYTAPGVEGCADGAIAMWAYASCTDGTFATCQPASVPGPEIRLVPPDNDLIITLQNTLPVASSLFIPGQLLSNNTGPVWMTDKVLPYTGATVSGTRSDPAQRVRSFAHEAAAGDTAVYQWDNLRPGTYLYESGTHPALQVQMGLYGALVVDVAAGQAYTGVTYDKDIVLLYSEIDPTVHEAADTMNPDDPPSTNTYEPQYFLVNGKGYNPSLSPLVAGTAGQSTLLRFLNAGLDTHMPSTPSALMTAIAEDGHPYAVPQVRTSLLLAAGTTKDVLLSPTPSAGYYPIYDRRLNLSNGAESPGGMLNYLEVPDAQFLLTVNPSADGTVAAAGAPGGILCNNSPGAKCAQLYNAGTTVRLSAEEAPGFRFTGWLIGGAADPTCPGTADCVVTMEAAKTVSANFVGVAAVRVISPNGREAFNAADYIAISWTAPAAATKFNLRYSLNNGATWWPIATDVTGNSYNWRLPFLGRQKLGVRVRVIGFNASGARVGSDVSDAPFAIKLVKVQSPNGGESWQSGTQHTIVWGTFGIDRPVAKVILEYSINKGGTWKVIDKLTSNPGFYMWDISAVAKPKPNSKVRVTLKDASGVVMSRDVSDAPFNIAPPPPP
jgi:FtsP/CotA-like multicopper oxidase with cupredoxin domain